MAKAKKAFYKQPWFIALVVVAVIGIWIVATYNGLIGMEQTVTAKWAQVETQYQRRYDLIPNLVNTVEEYEQFESSLLTELTELRSQWANADTVDEQIEVGTQLDSAISRLLLVYENYPELKTITAISSLMDELAGTENRIAVERMRYNDAVRSYNTAIKTFPTVVIANAFGFTDKPYFESAEGSETAPEVFA
jgi:LemA protein